MNLNNLDYEKLTMNLKCLKRQYPFLKMFSVGKSVMGRDLWCVKVGKGKRKILSIATHHALEWITGALSVSFLRDFSCALRENLPFLEEDILTLYENASYYIIPMLNPDGVDVVINGVDETHPYYEFLTSILPEKELKTHWQANVRGVDLNHNYDSGFLEGMMSAEKLGITSPNFTRYSGEYPFSESETKAIRSFLEEISFDAAIALHTQGEVIYAGESSDKEYIDLSRRLSLASGYELSTPEGVASFSGFKDWAMEKSNLPSFTIEFGIGKNPLPFSQFEKMKNPCYNIMKELAIY